MDPYSNPYIIPIIIPIIHSPFPPKHQGVLVPQVFVPSKMFTIPGALHPCNCCGFRVQGLGFIGFRVLLISRVRVACQELKVVEYLGTQYP